MTVQSWPGVYQTHVLVLQRDIAKLSDEKAKLRRELDDVVFTLGAVCVRLQAAEEKIRILEGREP